MFRPRTCWVLNLLLFLPWLFLQPTDGKSGLYIPSLFALMKANPFMRSEMFCDIGVSQNCAWNATEHIKWFSSSTSTLQLEGPVNDRRFSSSIIFYLGVDGKTGTEELTSPPFDPPKEGSICFSFRFYSMIEGESQDGLHLYMIDLESNNMTEIWSRSSVDIDLWIDEQVDVITNRSHKLAFRASGSGGFVALREFHQTAGFCDRACDFEAGICRGWTMKGFQLTKASESEFEHRLDHTTRSGFGNFAYMNLKKLKIHNEDSELIIEGPEMKNLGTQCFSFSFMRSAPDINFNLFVKTLSDDKYKNLWQSNNSHLANEWTTVRHTIKISAPIKLILQVPSKTKSTSLLAVDDISILPGECPKPLNCDFSSNFCLFHPNMKYSTHWSIGKGRVMNATKLTTDQKFMTGNSLLYTDFTRIDGSKPETMELISETVESPKSGMCLRMDMNVVSLGDEDKFALHQQTLDGNRTILWRWKSMKQKLNTWVRQQQIYVPNPETPYRIVLSAVSKSPSTRIAIDSLNFSSDLSDCRDVKGIPTASLKVSPTSKMPGKNPFSKLVCDFEEDTKADCGWLASDGEGNFTIMDAFSSKIPGKYIPSTDHTNQMATGGFTAAFNLRKSGKIDQATLTGQWPAEVSGSPICVDFAYFYYISGGGSGARLTVDKEKDSKVIWRAPPGISNQWHRVRFSFEPKNNKYSSLTFRTKLTEGVLALDDININIGLCDESLKVNQDRVCDFEDETTCDFNPLFVVDDMTWKLYKASDVIQNPDSSRDPHERTKETSMVDHSTGTKNGHIYGISFADLPKDSKSTIEDIITQSNVMNVKDPKINCIRFSYYLEDINQNTTIFGYQIKQKVPSDAHGQEILREWQISGSTNRHWFTHHVPVTWSADRVFTFHVKVKDLPKVIEKKSKVFIDDFTLSTDRCPMDSCNFEADSNCFLEPIAIGTHHMLPSISSVFTHNKINSLYPLIYLNDNVEQYFHMFSPFQDKSLGLKKANGMLAGNILLMTADEAYERAIMVTDRFVLSDNFGERQICLSFSVNKPEKVSYLQIIVGDSYTGKNVLLYTIDGSSTKGWKRFEIYAEPVNDNVLDMYFYFVGTVADKKSYIAIDDVQVKTFCDGKPANDFPNAHTRQTGSTIAFTGSTVSSTESMLPDPSIFKCRDGNKIPIEKVCDWISDCPDGTDELDCGNCNFKDNNMCGYEIIPQSEAALFGDFVWKLSNDKIEGMDDRTSEEDRLSQPYLIARNTHNFDFEKRNDDSLAAVVQSNVIHQSYASCRFQFEYRANGTKLRNNIFEAYIMNVDNEQKTTIWQNFMRPKMENMKWEKVSIDVGRMANRFLIGFSAIVADDAFESHSIKNIDMSNCEPPVPEKIERKCQVSDKYYCKNKVCIDISKRCNGVDNCGDHSAKKNSVTSIC